MARWSWLILAFYVILAVSAQESSTTGPAKTEKAGGQTSASPPAGPTKKTTTVATTTTTTKETTKTSPETTTETTEAPTTTTVPTTTVPTTTAVPTTVAPTPEPPSWPKNVGRWNITSDPSKKDVYCLVIVAALEIKLKYTTDKNTTGIQDVLVPQKADSQGKCAANVATLELTWTETINKTEKTNSLSLKFTKVNTTQGKENYGLTEIVLNVYNNQTGKEVKGSLSNQTLFQTPLSQSYKCSKDTPVEITDGVQLRVSSLQLEAFRATSFDKFSAELECSGDDVSAVVPFAVGASLALLVVIVLIAYLIGRRRSRARGYQSV